MPDMKGRFQKFALTIALGAALAGCCLLTCDGEKDADGFVRFDGRMPPEAPSDYFILRYERPDGVYTNGWKKGMAKWDFVEVRQLKEGATTLRDGVLAKSPVTVEPRNWAPRHSR